MPVRKQRKFSLIRWILCVPPRDLSHSPWARRVLGPLVMALSACSHPSVLEMLSERIPDQPPPGANGHEHQRGLNLVEGCGDGETCGVGVGLAPAPVPPGPTGIASGSGGRAPASENSNAAYSDGLFEFDGKELFFRGRIEFDDNNHLSTASRASLDALVRLLAASEGIRKVEIQGHVDNRGVGDAVAVSEVRATQVRDYLVAEGISDDRLTVRGFGDQMPIDSNRSEQGRAANRRIDFVVRAVKL